MADYRLYGFGESGNGYKVALPLNVAGADWEVRFVDYFGGETRTPEFRAINVMGEVPILEHAGQQLTQSGIILDYLTDVLGRFGPANEEERREIWRWILFDNHKLTSYTATLRFLLAFTETKEGPVIDFLRQRSEGALGVLNSHLEGRDFGVVWERDYPAIGRWLDKLKALPGWKHPYDMMPRANGG